MVGVCSEYILVRAARALLIRGCIPAEQRAHDARQERRFVFCTSKASKLSAFVLVQQVNCMYLLSSARAMPDRSTSKASKLSAFVLVKQVHCVYLLSSARAMPDRSANSCSRH